MMVWSLTGICGSWKSSELRLSEAFLITSTVPSAFYMRGPIVSVSNSKRRRHGKRRQALLPRSIRPAVVVNMEDN